ncbi:MAG: carboxypeptidase regulatory-like domain-containing protein [Deltaproteobacteria bacterium]|nr:carboxypeptidase regulatory-like domain-containing protein [Deltaproteobacteria bacterium]
MNRSITLYGLAALALALPACDGCELETVEDAPGTFKGTVCHQVTGRPSVGATITVKAKKSGGDIELTATSDGAGKFQLDNVPPGTARVTISGEGVHDLAVTPDPEIKTGLVTEWMDPMCIDPTRNLGHGCVTGQVCNRHTGGYVSGASVTVVLSNVQAQAGDAELATTTNPQGVFQICDVPEGTHTVLIRGVGYQKAYPATVTDGNTTEVVANPSCNAYDPQDYCVVQGRVCTSETPPGWLPDARVTAQMLDAVGNPLVPAVTEAEPEFTDAEGRYELYLQPEGRWRVQVQKGTFVSRQDVSCLKGETTVIQEGTQCVSAGECRFLVVTGIFDRIENVLGRVGVPQSRIDLVDGNPADLTDDWAFRTFGVASALEGYCGVFFNCGIDEAAFAGPFQNAVVLTNLRNWVSAGGTLYVSDEAYDVVENLYPGKLDFFRNDDLPSDAEYGLPGDVTASVVDESLRTYLGQDLVTIKFNYQSWTPIIGVDADVQVFLRGNSNVCADGEPCSSSLTLQQIPLTIRYPVGPNGGQVLFTSFHLETRPPPTDGGTPTEISTGDTDRVMRFLMTL